MPTGKEAKRAYRIRLQQEKYLAGKGKAPHQELLDWYADYARRKPGIRPLPGLKKSPAARPNVPPPVSSLATSDVVTPPKTHADSQPNDQEGVTQPSLYLVPPPISVGGPDEASGGTPPPVTGGTESGGPPPPGASSGPSETQDEGRKELIKHLAGLWIGTMKKAEPFIIEHGLPPLPEMIYPILEMALTECGEKYLPAGVNRLPPEIVVVGCSGWQGVMAVMAHNRKKKAEKAAAEPDIPMAKSPPPPEPVKEEERKPPAPAPARVYSDVAALFGA